MKKLDSKIFNYYTKEMVCSSCGKNDFNYENNSCNECGIKFKSKEQNYLLKKIIDFYPSSFLLVGMILIFIDLSISRKIYWGSWENFELTDLFLLFAALFLFYMTMLFLSAIILVLAFFFKWVYLKIQLIYSTDEIAYRIISQFALGESAKKQQVEKLYNDTIEKIIFSTICITIVFLYFFIKYIPK